MCVYIVINILLGFTTSGELEIRMVCPRMCGRSYKWKNHLTTHLKFECGVVPKFKCPYCSKMSKQKSNLKKHILCVHKVLFNDVARSSVDDN